MPISPASMDYYLREVMELKCSKCGVSIVKGVAPCNCEAAWNFVGDYSKLSQQAQAMLNGHIAPPPPRQPRQKRVGAYQNSGASLHLPHDIKATDWVRLAMELEKQGHDPTAAAKESGIAYESYTRIRDIVLLYDERENLSPEEAKTVLEAVELLNSTNKVKRPYAHIRQIADRVLGRKYHRFNKKSIERRAETFRNAITIVMDACEHGAEIPIPRLDKAQAKEAMKQLRRSEERLRVLKSRILEIYPDA